MPEYIVNQFYLGNFATFDPLEAADYPGGNGTVSSSNENITVAGFGPGTIFDASNMSVQTITENDTVIGSSTQRLEEDDYAGRNPIPGNSTNPGDSITYDLGDGPVTSTLDSVFRWNVLVTFGDGSTLSTQMVFMQLQDGSVFTNTGGAATAKNVQSITLLSYDSSNFYGTFVNWSIADAKIVCFAAGTMIRTADGDKPIEDLTLADRIPTADHGTQPLRWIGSHRLDRIDLMANPSLRPIRIQAGALAPNLPDADLLVSPQHRLLVRGNLPQRMFGQREILVAAKHLLTLAGVEIAEDVEAVTYFHLLLDDHEVIWANGAQAELLYLGSEAKKALTPEQVTEIAQIFPEFARDEDWPMSQGGDHPAARLLVNGRRGRRMAERLAQNGQRLQ